MRFIVRALALGLMIAIYCGVGLGFEVPIAAALETLPPVTTLSDWHGDFYDGTGDGYVTFLTKATGGGFRAFGIEVRRLEDGTLVGRVVFNIYLPSEATVGTFRLQLSRNLLNIAAAPATLVASGVVDLARVPAPCCEGGDSDVRLAVQLISFGQGFIGGSLELQASWDPGVPH